MYVSVLAHTVNEPLLREPNDNEFAWEWNNNEEKKKKHENVIQYNGGIWQQAMT